MLLKLKLEQNRSNPPRYTRYIRYVREGDMVVPYGVRDGKAVRLDWSVISGTEPDPELVRQWRQHVDSQEVTEAETFAEAWVAHVRRQRELDRRAA